MNVSCDDMVRGAGISGAAAAFELAAGRRVVVLEAESVPGYHSTGRSAALYTRNFGNRVVRALNRAGLPFFDKPPAGFADRPLLTPRGALTIGGADGRSGVDEMLALGAPDGSIVEIGAARAVELAPLLRPERVAFAAYEAGVMGMDVAAIHQGFLRGLAARGGRVVCDAPATEIGRRNGTWMVTANGATYAAPVLVNAAGAWADEIARRAGVAPLGLVPKRRTAIIVDLPPGTDTRGWAVFETVGHGSYCKPETGRVMASPADATPTEPGDVQPEEIDIAIVADWLEQTTTLALRRIARSWAGLRSFVADETPVVGFDDASEGFFWLCGQGGHGIMLAPTLGRAAADLIGDGRLPADIREAGVSAEDLAPARLRTA